MSFNTQQQPEDGSLPKYRTLLEVAEVISTHHDLSELFRNLAPRLRLIIDFDFINIVLHDAERNVMRLHVLETPIPNSFPIGWELPVEQSPGGWVWQHQQPLHVPDISQAIAIENALSFQQIVELQNKLADEKLYLEDEIRTKYGFEEIIGQSIPLKRILQEVETVAPTDSTVLIQGETGTGKEIIARAIHNLSERRERTLVKVNCAAIPSGLLESELFGHEKGAFTGANSQRAGRFELAHHGTLFLDEVGDIPGELQPKLLRVLQEQEFERLGSSRTIRVDVRLIAATNADLDQMVADKKFRRDLYYRLNVFPIQLPPLRERREDIPLLVRYFVQKYALRMKKQIDAVPAKVMEALSGYDWPGNVRELENFMERTVILSRSSRLEISHAELMNKSKPTAAQETTSMTTLVEAERGHILRALRESKWVISGPTGAAARLGMKRTTLYSRMRKLKITRPTTDED